MMSMCRSEYAWTRLVMLALAAMLLALARLPGEPPRTGTLRPEEAVRPPRPAVADFAQMTRIESNAFLARRALQNDAVLVAYGTEMEPHEFESLREALAMYPCVGANTQLREELLSLRSEWRAALYRRLGTEAERLLPMVSDEALVNGLLEAMSLRTVARLPLDEFDLEMGIATFRYWKSGIRLSADRTDLLRQQTERTILLPNTYQPYLRLVLRDR